MKPHFLYILIDKNKTNKILLNIAIVIPFLGFNNFLLNYSVILTLKINILLNNFKLFDSRKMLTVKRNGQCFSFCTRQIFL